MSSNTTWVLLIDDDTNLVCATADLIGEACDNAGARLRVCTSTHELPGIYKDLRSERVALAILDLWLIDKQTNVPDHDGGMKVLQELRQHWSDCYVIILSAHLTTEAKAQLDKYDNIAIVEKPVPTWEVTDMITKVLAAEISSSTAV